MINLAIEIEEYAEVLSEKFLNGRIEYVMDELGTMSKYESMIMVIKINECFKNSSNRESFQLEIMKRIDDYGPR